MRYFIWRLVEVGFIYFFLKNVAIAENAISMGSITLSDLPTEVIVPVSLSSDQDLTSLNLEISYDPALLSTEVDQIKAQESRFTELGLTNITASADNTIGVIRWTVAGFLGEAVITSGLSELFSITFSVHNALIGERALLTFGNIDATDSTINIVPFSSKDGEIIGPPEVLGFGSFNPLLLPGAIEFFVDYTTRESLRYLEIAILMDPRLIETDVIEISPIPERISPEAGIFYSLDEESGLLTIIVSDTLHGKAITEGAGSIFKVNFTPNIDVLCANSQVEIINAVAVNQSSELFQPILTNVQFNARSPVIVEKVDSGNSLEVGTLNDRVYTVTLQMQPESNVIITAMFDDEIIVSPSTLEFTPETWNELKTVSVMAVEEVTLEAFHSSTITHSAESNDPRFNHVFVCDITVPITDFVIVAAKGWNLISFPFVTERRFAEIFNNVLVGNVWRWDNTIHRVGWVPVAGLESPILFKSYWLYAKEKTMLDFAEEFNDSLPTSGQLNEGWNLYGPVVQIRTPYNKNIIGTIWFWDANQFKAVPREGSMLEPGKGYWINSRYSQIYP